MNDLERLLKESLKSVGETYEPRDVLAAQDEFRRRRLRRRIGWATATGLATTAAVAGAFFFIQPTDTVAPERKQPELAPIALPDETIGIQQVLVGDIPSGVEVGDDSAWVANASGSVSRVDLDTKDVTPIRIGTGKPDDVAIAGSTAWIVDDDNESVIPIDGLRVGNPVDVAGPSNIDIAASDDGGVFAVSGDDNVYRIDKQGAGPHVSFDGTLNDIAISSNTIWVFDGESGSVGSVSTAATQVSELEEIAQTGGSGADIAADSDTVWIASPLKDRLVVLDARSMEIIRSIDLPVDATWAGIALGMKYAWVVADDSAGGAVLLRIDTDTLQYVKGDFPDLQEPYDVAVSNGAVWVVDQAQDSVFVLPVDDIPAE
jgi:hypothetical protein